MGTMNERQSQSTTSGYKNSHTIEFDDDSVLFELPEELTKASIQKLRRERASSTRLRTVSSVNSALPSGGIELPFVKSSRGTSDPRGTSDSNTSKKISSLDIVSEV